MLIITREKAASCTDSDLHSFLRVLFNELANEALDDIAGRCCQASIQAIRTERAHPRRGHSCSVSDIWYPFRRGGDQMSET